MYNYESFKKSKSNLGGSAMSFAFFKHKDLMSRYRRKPQYLNTSSVNNDLYYFLILNKHN